MFEFQGTMYFFKTTNLMGLDKLGGEVSILLKLWQADSCGLKLGSRAQIPRRCSKKIAAALSIVSWQ